MFGDKTDGRNRQDTGDAILEVLRALLALEKSEIDKKYGAGSADKFLRENSVRV